MKVLDRSMFRELVVPFLIGTVGVVLMFQANVVIYVFKTFSANNIPLPALLKVILFQTPSFLIQTLPVGTSIAVSLALSRLARESEITAIRAAGTPLRRIILPVLAFGFFVSCLNFYVAERVAPQTDQQAKKLGQDMAILGVAVPDFRSNVSINLQNKYSVNLGSVEKDPLNGGLKLSRILLYERPQLDTIWLWTAETGTYVAGVWTLQDTQLLIIKKGDLSSWKPGKDVVINDPIEINNLLSDPAPEGQSLAQLKATIAEGKRIGRDTAVLEVAYHERFSVPAACFIFALTGTVCAVWLGRRGGFLGVFVGLLVVILYYNVYVVCTKVLAPNHFLSPAVAAWFPDALFLILGLIGLRRLE